jgi:hypothetical protein
MLVTLENVRREATLTGQMGVHGLEMDPAWLTSSLKNEAYVLAILQTTRRHVPGDRKVSVQHNENLRL